MESQSFLSTWTLRTVTLTLACLLTGCAGPRKAERFQAPSSRDAERRSCFLILENESISDLRIYALRGETTRIPLGTVGSLEEKRVRIPQALLGTRYINLVAVPFAAGDSFTSERVYLEDGTDVIWRLKNDLVFSTVFIRSRG